MKTTRNLVIDEAEFSPLLEELLSISDCDITGIDTNSQEGQDFAKKYPNIYRLQNILKSEIMKEQSTYNYERIKG